MVNIGPSQRSRRSGANGVCAILFLEGCQDSHQLRHAGCRQGLAAVEERFVVLDPGLSLREVLSARTRRKNLRNERFVDVTQRLK
jgi:hypothetical protein